MREIKFRAWVPKMKKMFYNVGFCSRGVEVYWYDPKLEEETVLGDRQENSLLQYVIPLQYTGLKDKNGKEIWEGDIVKYLCTFDDPKRPGIEEVKWDDHITGFHPFNVYDSDCGEYVELEKVEIIGNIYENPELMEKK